MKKKTNPAEMLTHPESQKPIADFLENLRFRRAFMGIDEEEVWERIGELNAMYEKLLLAENAKNQAIIAELRAALAEKGGADGA